MSSLDHGYWKSLAELDRDVPVEAAEIPAADGPNEDGVDPLSRRNFAKLMGASFALAGIAGAGCKRWEREEIVPLARRPEDMVPGVTQDYATAFELGGHAQALIAVSYEGRPIRVEGNPEHPFAGGGVLGATKRHGASTAFALGSILHLYDPDRSQQILNAGKGAMFGDWKAWIGELRKAGNLQRVRVLSEATSSPTVRALRRRLDAELPGLQWHEWEPLSWDNERAGMIQAFGRVVRPLAHLDLAETIVSLDCDFCLEHPAALRYTRDFTRGRHPEHSTLGAGKMNRLYAIESAYTTTGVTADHRLSVRSEHVLAIAQLLESLLSGGARPTAEVASEARVTKVVEALAREIKVNAGRVAFLAGRRQPAAVHALAARLNLAYGSGVVEHLEDPEPARPTHSASIAALATAIKQQQVETLFIVGGNPVYDAPADLDFAGLLGAVKTSVHLSEYANETSKKTTWHVPKAHYLEAWGDAQTWDGTYTLQQPLIAPMYGGISTVELLALLLGDETPADKLVEDTFKKAGYGGTWRQAIHDGFVAKTQLAPAVVQSTGGAGSLAGAGGGSSAKNGELEVTFLASTQTWDGRFANNAWLQETPDFLTKVTWDNVALVSPDTADSLGGITSQDMIRIEVGDRKLDIVALVMPGQAKGSIGVILGGGRTAAGKVGNKQGEQVGGGFDAYKLRTSAGLDFVTKAKVTRTGGRYQLATTQEHHDIRHGLSIDPNVGRREEQKKIPDLIREVAKDKLDGYKAEKAHPYYHDHHHGRGYSLYEEKTYTERKWAMAIDLGNCSGCNACLVACQSENNVPVVGKKEVARNREMSWLRIDRYFKGDLNNPEVVGQPVGCQHCENAPCETVCPVGATLHSSEGLNDMVYNRCVGTRYCLNNCPYRVRRFNFFDYHKEFQDARNNVRKLLFNPEVTVRERGVMEKCSYCVQRIQNAKITAKNAGHGRGKDFLPDGTITTACQAACPSEAIVFGDLSDPDSRVSKLHADRRQYELLGELNDKPRTRFLARVRNPNPELVS